MVAPVLDAIGVACWAFFATNMDDLLILIMFYTEASLPPSLNPSGFHRHHIFVGQALGFTLMIALSLIGFIGGMFFPVHYVGMLGFLPIFTGCWRLRDLRPDTARARLHPEESVRADPEVTTPTAVSFVLTSPRTYTRVINMNVARVTTMTLLNGGDNVSAYTALFVSMDVASLVACISTLFALLAALVTFADYFARIPAVAEKIVNSAKFVVPFVQMALGIYLLFKTGASKVLASVAYDT